MRAYGELIQEPEEEIGCDVLTHQKYVDQLRRPKECLADGLACRWSGANLVDNSLMMVQGGMSSTAAMGSG